MERVQWAKGHFAQGVCVVHTRGERVTDVQLLSEAAAAALPLVANDDAASLAQDAVSCVLRELTRPTGHIAVPLALEGTALQQRVWQALGTIPLGQSITYAALAERLGVVNGCRAVANACGANRLAVLVPCHRVRRSDGGLGGYRWGVERKRALLALEAQTTNGVPKPIA